MGFEESNSGLAQRPRATARHLAFASDRPRTIHVIDLENLVRGRASRHRLIKAALCAYEAAIRPEPSDTAIVGVKANFHIPTNNVRESPPGLGGRGCNFDFKLVIGHNEEDGADEALLTAVELMQMRRSPPLVEDYKQASFATGDHMFVPTAAGLQGEGMTIVQVIGMGKVSGDWSITVEVIEKKIRKPIRKVYAEIYPDAESDL